MTNGRIRVECECGVRLDVLSTYWCRFRQREILQCGDTRGVADRWPNGRKVKLADMLAAYQGPHVAPDAMGDGSSITYSCRKCGKSRSIRRDRLLALVKSAQDRGLSRLVAGIDA